jgi:hypothetical protein
MNKTAKPYPIRNGKFMFRLSITPELKSIQIFSRQNPRKETTITKAM